MYNRPSQLASKLLVLSLGANAKQIAGSCEAGQLRKQWRMGPV